VHEVNTVAGGLNPGRWLLGWAKRTSVPVVPGVPSAPSARMRAASRLILAFCGLTVAAMLAGTGVGYRLARQSDERALFEQHAALRSAISEFRAPVVRSREIDPRLMHMAEQIAGVKNIKFKTDPDTSDHEMQPVVNADGRISGFFIWDRPRPLTQVMDRLAPIAAAIAFVLAGFAALSVWQLKHARRELAWREAEAARAADED